MTPPTDTRQRMAAIVLCDLLERQLPALHHWVVDRVWDTDDVEIDGWVNKTPEDGEDMSDHIATIAAWSRALSAPIRTTSRRADDDPYSLWSCDTVVDGINVTIYARITHGHEPPQLVDLLPSRADMYVRRSNGQLAEAVTSC